MFEFATTIEIAMLILLPLIVFYQRSAWKTNEYIFLLPLIYVLWYLSYAFLHEICHLSAAILLGKKVYDFQLIPHFWKGQKSFGYVNSEYNQITVLMPYIKDIVFSITGLILLLKKSIKKPFLTGLALTLLVLSPLFDVANNYLIFVKNSINDFRAFSELTNAFYAHFIGTLFMIVTLFITIIIINRAKNYPNHVEGKGASGFLA